MRRRAYVLLAAAVVMLGAATSNLLADREPAQSSSTPQSVAAARPAAPVQTPPSSDRELVQKYCLTCHNERTKTGGLVLENLDPSDTAAHAEIWERVARKVRGGMMPPQGMPRPDEPTLDAF